jgi:hypothetical protein
MAALLQDRYLASLNHRNLAADPILSVLYCATGAATPAAQRHPRDTTGTLPYRADLLRSREIQVRADLAHEIGAQIGRCALAPLSAWFKSRASNQDRGR